LQLGSIVAVDDVVVTVAVVIEDVVVTVAVEIDDVVVTVAVEFDGAVVIVAVVIDDVVVDWSSQHGIPVTVESTKTPTHTPPEPQVSCLH